MRPDQHKQKRSTQYKKKHGIGDKPKVEGGNNNTNTNDSREKGISGKGSTDWQKPDNSKDDTKSKYDGKNNESSAEEDDVPALSFRRRKIISNWDRYESLPPQNEDENPSVIGADFGKLITQTADALSQFRFKDEKEWEEDKTLLSSNFVALDCEALANSLQCLPLHERLGLDAVLFSGEQLKTFSAEADKNRMLYNPGSCSTIVQEDQLDVNAMHSVLSAAMHLVPAILKTVKDAERTPPPETNGAATDAVPIVKAKAEETLLPDNEDSTLTNVVKEPVSDSAKEPKPACVVPQVVPQVVRKPVSQEDELDMLLSFGDAKPQTDVGESGKADQSVEISASVEKKYVSSATASLEDWLDSVLDS